MRGKGWKIIFRCSPYWRSVQPMTNQGEWFDWWPSTLVALDACALDEHHFNSCCVLQSMGMECEVNWTCCVMPQTHKHLQSA
jgi:hypothetical protein